MKGYCSCRETVYEMRARPLFVHACHCRWCQRETGTAFVMNAMIETACVEITAGQTVEVLTPSASGKGQTIVRCPTCHIALWSHYAGAGDKLAFVRVGTLDDAALLTPDIHIYTSTKQPWVTLPADRPAVPEYYKAAEMWPAESLERAKAVRRT